jgi:hypothetical protein
MSILRIAQSRVSAGEWFRFTSVRHRPGAGFTFLCAFAGSAIGYEENEKGREHQTSTHYETYPKTVWKHDASISQQRTIKDTTLVSASSIESH